MKAFIAYRFSGENITKVMPLLMAVRDSLKKKGVESYCTLFDEERFRNNGMSAKEIMSHAFSIIDDSDFLFVLQRSEEKSEGMLMEVGYCIAENKPIIVATKSRIYNTYLPQLATIAFEWSGIEDLSEKIGQLNLEM